MRACTKFALIMSTLLVVLSGCKKQTIDKAELKSAIDSYLSTRHECVWSAPTKLPAEAATSDEESTRGYDALTDAGLLVRTPQQKKRFLIGSKQVNDYDLSDKGRAAWTADPSQPGYGNFCFGRFTVTSIDNFTPNDASKPTQYSVNYHYTVQAIPDWANSAETRTAFPKIASDMSTQTATATIVKGTNGGWAVVPPQPAPTGE
jgi:hypothetical protein